MLSISDSEQKCTLKWPLDDYVMHMVVRRGPVVSKRREGLYVEARDMTGLVFRMALVEASQLSERHEAFDGDGLVGTWQLVGSTGRLKLLKTFAGDATAEAVRAFLLKTASTDAVRQRYAAALGANKATDVVNSMDLDNPVGKSPPSSGEVHKT